MEAVGVGYVFNLFDEGDLPGVDLRETGEYVRVDGSLYPLMKAATYEQSRMVDAALDIRGERRVDDFRWEEPRLPDGRGALAALLGGDDFYNPGACPFSGNGAEMQRNTGYFPTESLEPSGNRLFSRSALNEGDLFRGSLVMSCS